MEAASEEPQGPSPDLQPPLPTPAANSGAECVQEGPMAAWGHKEKARQPP